MKSVLQFAQVSRFSGNAAQRVNLPTKSATASRNSVLQCKLQQTINNSPRQAIQRQKIKSAFGTQSPIQCAFPGEFVDLISGALQSGEYSIGDQTECHSNAEWAYDILSKSNQQQGPKDGGSGDNMDSLIMAITQAERQPNDVFTFLVIMGAIGHDFTILQQGTEATLIQAYRKHIIFPENIDGDARNIKPIQDVKSHLKNLRDKYEEIGKETIRNCDHPVGKSFMKSHSYLFPTNMNDVFANQEIQQTMQNVAVHKKGISWQASYIRGLGPNLTANVPVAATRNTRSGCGCTIL